MEILQVSSIAASIVSLGYALWPNIAHQSVKHRKAAWYAVAFFIFITTALFFTNSETSLLSSNLTTQSGNVEISNRSTNQHEVFYPVPYTSPPNLKVNISVGSGNLNIKEQRADGFIVKVSDLGYAANLGAYIEWIASGHVKGD